jgi:hypothetical protein
MYCYWDEFFLGWWPLLFSPEWWVHILVRGVWFPSHLPLEGNQAYPEFLVVTGDPRYPGYLTPTVAPEPSIEWVVRAGHSTVGRIGTHMLLQALPWDSAVRL